MLSNLFLGMALVGSEWVLYLLLILSVFSVALIIERITFYRGVKSDAEAFRRQIRQAAASGDWNGARKAVQARLTSPAGADFETAVASAVLSVDGADADALAELAQDEILRTRLKWEKHLAILATIGSNAPFVGLFGTVLGIIEAFNQLSQQAVGTASAGVMSGISEALIATAIGIFVAIPAVVAFNLFQRRVKSGLAEAEALKSYLIGRLSAELAVKD